MQLSRHHVCVSWAEVATLLPALQEQIFCMFPAGLSQSKPYPLAARSPGEPCFLG